MLTIHHLGISQSDRIVWLCEELGVPYDLVRHERDPITRLAPATYKALHPAGTAPVIADDGLVLAESGAIIDYIVAKYSDGRLTLTPEHPDFAAFLYWYHFANGSLMPAITGIMATGPMGDVLKQRVERGLTALDDRLRDNDWLSGETFTTADIMMAFPLTTMRHFVAVDLTPYPNILAYLQRLGARPAFRRAMAKADPGFEVPLT